GIHRSPFPGAVSAHHRARAGHAPDLEAGRRMNILGLNAYHGDVSAVLVRDGVLVAAVEEERFRRIKHITGFPAKAIESCLRIGGMTAGDVDLFAVSRRPHAHLWRKALFVLENRPKRTLTDRARNMASISRLS